MLIFTACIPQLREGHLFTFPPSTNGMSGLPRNCHLWSIREKQRRISDYGLLGILPSCEEGNERARSSFWCRTGGFRCLSCLLLPTSCQIPRTWELWNGGITFFLCFVYVNIQEWRPVCVLCPIFLQCASVVCKCTKQIWMEFQIDLQNMCEYRERRI